MLYELARVLRYPRMLALHGLLEKLIYDYVGVLREAAEIVVPNPLCLCDGSLYAISSRAFLDHECPASACCERAGSTAILRFRYPRITYLLSLATQRNLDLTAKLPSELADMVRLCLRGPGNYVSQELATIWISEGIDSVVFPSATGAGRNIAFYLSNAAADSCPGPQSCRSFGGPSPTMGGEAWPVAFRFSVPRPSRTDLLCENQNVESREKSPPSCPPTGVFLVLNLNFLAKIFAV